MGCGVGCRRGSDPTLLWLWRSLVATAPIQPPAWEPPYAEGAALEKAGGGGGGGTTQWELLSNFRLTEMCLY